MAKTPFSQTELDARLTRWDLKRPNTRQQFEIAAPESNFFNAVDSRGLSKSFTIRVDGHNLVITKAQPDSSGLAGHRDFYGEGTYKGIPVRSYFIGKGAQKYMLIIEHA